MQHHGAPTRLLDFTYSIYVAAYFALEGACCDSAIWALDSQWALRESASLFTEAKKPDVDQLRDPSEEGHEQYFDTIFRAGPFVKAVCPLNPFRLDERLRTQRGVSLVAADITCSLEENIRALPGHDAKECLVKIGIPFSLRNEAIKHLFDMNISRTSLFPGLDGFAQSLGVYHPAFDPVPADD